MPRLLRTQITGLVALMRSHSAVGRDDFANQFHFVHADLNRPRGRNQAN